MHSQIRLLEPVPWRPGLAGDYPGQESFIELGSARVPMLFCWCPPTPPGQPFLMGSPPDERERRDNENQHPIEFPQGFWLATHPVNQQQWRAFMDENPSSRGKGELCPVDTVSWNDAREFCQKAGLRLPREAEWEYACRAGTTTPFGIGTGQCLNAQRANFDGNYPYGAGPEAFKWAYRERTLPRGGFPPNAWGLHDMHGQLWEWCEDVYEGDSGVRVLRGGCWFNYARYARSASRLRDSPEARYVNFCFRPCPSSTRAQVQAEGQPRSGARSEARDKRNDGPA